MTVLNCVENDTVYCLKQFTAAPFVIDYGWEHAHEFYIGETVTFLWKRLRAEEWRTPPQRGYMVVFADKDGLIFEALEDYFGTHEDWISFSSL